MLISLTVLSVVMLVYPVFAVRKLQQSEEGVWLLWAICFIFGLLLGIGCVLWWIIRL